MADSSTTTPADATPARIPPEPHAPALARPAPAWRRYALRTAGALAVVAALVSGARYWLWARDHETTDDAFIDVHVVDVSSRVAGRVLRVHPTDNQLVGVETMVVEPDPADFQARLDEAVASRAMAEGQLAEARAGLVVAEAAAAQAKAEVVAARADAALAAADLARYRATTSGAVSKQAVDTATTAATRSAAQVEVKVKAADAAAAQTMLALARIEAAEASVASAAATVEQERLQLEYTVVHAPVAGRVTNKNVMPGDWVASGQTLFALVPEDVWVTANFKETQLRRMRPGQPVTVHVDAYDRDFAARVDSVEAGSGAFFSLLPPENATGNYVKVVQRVPVKIVFTEPIDDVLLGPGMSVEPTVDVR